MPAMFSVPERWPRLLAAAHHQRGVGRAGAHVQHADALRRIQLVAGKRRVVDAGGGQVEAQLAERLHAVDHPQRGRRAFGQHRLDRGQVGDDAGFIVGGHGADHRRARRQLAQQVEPVPAGAVDRQRVQRQAGAEHRVPVRQAFRHRLVLGGAVQQQVAHRLAAQLARADVAQRRQHGGLDAFGGAAGKHQAGRRRRRAGGARGCAPRRASPSPSGRRRGCCSGCRSGRACASSAAAIAAGRVGEVALASR